MFSLSVRILYASIKSAIDFTLFALHTLLNKTAMNMNHECRSSRKCMPTKQFIVTMLMMYIEGTTRVKDRNISRGRAL